MLWRTEWIFIWWFLDYRFPVHLAPSAAAGHKHSKEKYSDAHGETISTRVIVTAAVFTLRLFQLMCSTPDLISYSIWPTGIPLNEGTLWQRLEQSTLGFIEPWVLTDSELRLSATHRSKNSPFRELYRVITPLVCFQSLVSTPYLWLNQAKDSNFYYFF